MIELFAGAVLVACGAVGGAALFWLALWLGNRSTGIVPRPPLVSPKPPAPTPDPEPEDRETKPLPFLRQRDAK